jgi:hypothetical protein
MYPSSVGHVFELIKDICMRWVPEYDPLLLPCIKLDTSVVLLSGANEMSCFIFRMEQIVHCCTHRMLDALFTFHNNNNTKGNMN